MNELRVEQGSESTLPRCPCCGGETRVVRGFVYADEAPHAVYLVRWSPARPQHDAEIAVSLGGFTEGEPESARRFVLLNHRLLDGKPAFMVVDAPGTSWAGDRVLGRPLTREEALRTIAKDAFAVVDAVGEQDGRVQGWLLS